MMAGPVIRLGDKTSHDGVVVGASQVSTSGGVPVARVSDKVECPRAGHNSCVIVSGDRTMLVDGQQVARHGDKTSCGATLFASQQNTVGQV